MARRFPHCCACRLHSVAADARGGVAGLRAGVFAPGLGADGPGRIGGALLGVATLWRGSGLVRVPHGEAAGRTTRRRPCRGPDRDDANRPVSGGSADERRGDRGPLDGGGDRHGRTSPAAIRVGWGLCRRGTAGAAQPPARRDGVRSGSAGCAWVDAGTPLWRGGDTRWHRRPRPQHVVVRIAARLGLRRGLRPVRHREHPAEPACARTCPLRNPGRVAAARPAGTVDTAGRNATGRVAGDGRRRRARRGLPALSSRTPSGGTCASCCRPSCC